MLGQRVVTAVVLAALLLWALAQPGPWPFALLALLLVAAAGWEWGRLNGARGAAALGFGVVVGSVGCAALVSPWARAAPAWVWWAAVGLWAAGGFVALRSGPAAWPQLPRTLRWALGVVALVAAWLALANARALGVNFLLSTLCVVWMADVAAYFGGRALGRRKLAPSISPGKSWEGVWSGMVGVLLLAGLWVALDRRFGFDGPSLFSRLLEGIGLAGLAMALVVLCAGSVVGDLVESLVKRAAGAKDSSRLLPGHGGVLDRIDALLPALPLALALNTLARP